MKPSCAGEHRPISSKDERHIHLSDLSLFLRYRDSLRYPEVSVRSLRQAPKPAPHETANTHLILLISFPSGSLEGFAKITNLEGFMGFLHHLFDLVRPLLRWHLFLLQMKKYYSDVAPDCPGPRTGEYVNPKI